MKPATAKAKGRAVENAVVAFLQSFGLPVERRRLQGAKDKGDIAGWQNVAVEVKSGGGTLKIPEWLRETAVEKENAGAEVAVLIVRPRGVTDPSEFWAIQPLGEWLQLMDLAGYLDNG